MPFLWESSPPADCNEINCSAKFPCSAASLLCPFRVARVSRLIGKSDITVNRCGWQVEPCRSVGSGSAARHLHQESQAPQNRKERHSQESGAPWSLCWSLAPQDYVGNGIFPLHLLETSRSVSLFGAASLAVTLTGRLLYFGLVEMLPAPKHHWRLSNSNRYAIHHYVYFQYLTPLVP